MSLSRTNQSQAKFKSAVGWNLLQSWVNLTIVLHHLEKGSSTQHFGSKEETQRQLSKELTWKRDLLSIIPLTKAWVKDDNTESQVPILCHNYGNTKSPYKTASRVRYILFCGISILTRTKILKLPTCNIKFKIWIAVPLFTSSHQEQEKEKCLMVLEKAKNGKPWRLKLEVEKIIMSIITILFFFFN